MGFWGTLLGALNGDGLIEQRRGVVERLNDAHRELLRACVAAARVKALDDAAALHESVNPASDDERGHGVPGAGAMGAVIEYRDKIRALKDGCDAG